MSVSVWTITLFAFIPMLVSILGGWIASIYVPKTKYVCALQHFVAGIVIGAVALELVPKILGHSSPWTIGLGFAIGVAVMLLVHEFSHFLAHKEKKRGLPLGLMIGSGLDLLIDGVLIGVAFLAGRESGIVIALSLSLCAFFLNVTVSSTLTQKKVNKGVQAFSIVLIALMLPIGALIGSAVISQLPQIILVETIAFGVAALLFLGVEELLAEAHGEGHDTLWVSAAFFIGFLVILLFRV